MLKVLSILIILFTLQKVSFGQSKLSNRYVDDRINNLTYLQFNPDSTFQYHYLYDMMGDFATGHYKRSRDTLFLFYNPDSTLIKDKAQGMLTSQDVRNRADTLMVRFNKLFRVINGISLYDTSPDVLSKKLRNGWKPSRNSAYRRKFILFGKYRTVRSKRYYMIVNSDAIWNRHN